MTTECYLIFPFHFEGGPDNLFSFYLQKRQNKELWVCQAGTTNEFYRWLPSRLYIVVLKFMFCIFLHSYNVFMIAPPPPKPQPQGSERSIRIWNSWWWIASSRFGYIYIYIYVYFIRVTKRAPIITDQIYTCIVWFDSIFENRFFEIQKI